MTFLNGCRWLRRLPGPMAIAVSLAADAAGQALDDKQARVLALHFARRDSTGFAGVDEAYRSVLRDALGDRLD